MITLNLPTDQKATIQQASEKAGMTIEDYIISKTLSLPTYEEPSKVQLKTLADLVAGKKLQGFTDNPVAIQRELRNEWE